MISDTISVNGDLLSFRGKEAGQTYQVFYTLKSEKEQQFLKVLIKRLSCLVRLTWKATGAIL